MKRTALFFGVVLCLFVIFPVSLQAESNVKWQQRPDMEHGINVPSNPRPIGDIIQTVGDDWLCLDGSPVSDVHFWGSYLGWLDTTPKPTLPPPGIEVFRIRVYSDSPPTTPDSFSRPDKLLYEVWVDNFTETYVASIPVTWPPEAEYEHKFRYDLDLPRMFWQSRDDIYWLNISAVPRNPLFQWGWESSMDRWNDVAVSGYYVGPDHWFWKPIENPMTAEYVNMSFELTTCEGPIKWLQFPDMANGINILSYPEPVVADDFLCTDGNPIREVQFWGSYLDPKGDTHWEQGNPGPPQALLPPAPGVKAFKLSFHKDIPAGEDPEMPWSHPGELLQEIIVDYSDVREQYWDSIPHEGLEGRIWWEHKFHYVVRLKEPFEQKQGVIYWLDVGARPLVDSTWHWGWETSKDHWNDNAVRGIDGRWSALGKLESGFEDLPLGATYSVGNSVVTANASLAVMPFQDATGTWTSSGTARVENGGRAGGTGQEISVRNVNLELKTVVPLTEVSLRFGHYGGNLNVKVNGDFRNVMGMSQINGATIGGAKVAVVNYSANTGRVTVSGPIDQFAIGGQEFYIDDVGTAGEVDMAFLLSTEDDTPYCKADFKRDGDVDGSDLAMFIRDYGNTNCYASGDCEGDFHYDGDVDAVDLRIIAPEFARTDCPCSLPSPPVVVTETPDGV